MGSDGGWLRTASPTSAVRREVNRLVLQASSSIAARRFAEMLYLASHKKEAA
jgi:hypothetical protein